MKLPQFPFSHLSQLDCGCNQLLKQGATMYSLTFCLAIFCLQQLSENGNKKLILMIKNVIKQFYQSSDIIQTYSTMNRNGNFGLVFDWGEILLTYMILVYYWTSQVSRTSRKVKKGQIFFSKATDKTTATHIEILQFFVLLT